MPGSGAAWRQRRRHGPSCPRAWRFDGSGMGAGRTPRTSGSVRPMPARAGQAYESSSRGSAVSAPGAFSARESEAVSGTIVEM